MAGLIVGQQDCKFWEMLCIEPYFGILAFWMMCFFPKNIEFFQSYCGTVVQQFLLYEN